MSNWDNNFEIKVFGEACKIKGSMPITSVARKKIKIKPLSRNCDSLTSFIVVRAGNGTQSGDLRACAHPPVQSFKKGGAPPCFSANKEAIDTQKEGLARS